MREVCNESPQCSIDRMFAHETCPIKSHVGWQGNCMCCVHSWPLKAFPLVLNKLNTSATYLECKVNILVACVTRLRRKAHAYPRMWPSSLCKMVYVMCSTLRGGKNNKIYITGRLSASGSTALAMLVQLTVWFAY